MPRMNMVQAINKALVEEMDRDGTVVVLGEDVGRDGGVFRVTDGLLDRFGADRVMDTPLAESGIMGTSIGMAMGGLKPVAEIQFSGFSYYILHQLEGHAARYRSRTQGTYSVPLVVRMPYGGGVRALEHHSESKEIFYAAIPGIKTVIPSGPRVARAAMAAAIRDPDPVIFMEPKRSYRAFKEDVPEEPEVLELGRPLTVQEGDDLTLIAWGAMMRPALEAARRLGERGVSVTVIDLLTISPFDDKPILEAVRRTGRVVVVQEAARSFGPSSEIVARINDGALLYLEAPVGRVTGYDVTMPYFGREELFLPDADRVERVCLETLEF